MIAVARRHHHEVDLGAERVGDVRRTSLEAEAAASVPGGQPLGRDDADATNASDLGERGQQCRARIVPGPDDTHADGAAVHTRELWRMEREARRRGCLDFWVGEKDTEVGLWTLAQQQRVRLLGALDREAVGHERFQPERRYERP